MKNIRLTIGNTVRHTRDDVDFLCNGNNDNSKINAAIHALPAEGGEVVILEGVYNITSNIYVDKDRVTIIGMGEDTVLSRKQNDSTNRVVIFVNGTNSAIKNLVIKNLYVDGAIDEYPVYRVSDTFTAYTPRPCENELFLPQRRMN